MKQPALPTFFVIGAAKAGTTSLHSYLRLHPEVQMSAIKEPGYFAGPANGRPYPKGRISRREDYEALFDRLVPVRGESSPNYAMHPIRSGVPERIATLAPQARLIYLLRDPVDRAISHHHHAVALGEQNSTLQELLDSTSDPREEPETCMSLYGLQLERYLSVFPQERILLVEHSQLLQERGPTLRSIFSFLGVDPGFADRGFTREHYATSERRAYPRGYEELVGRTLAPRLRWVPASARRRARAGLERTLFRRLSVEPPTDGLRDRLAEMFASDTARLRSLSGRSFAEWSM